MITRREENDVKSNRKSHAIVFFSESVEKIKLGMQMATRLVKLLRVIEKKESQTAFSDFSAVALTNVEIILVILSQHEKTGNHCSL